MAEQSVAQGTTTSPERTGSRLERAVSGMRPAAVELESVTKAFGEARVLEDISLRIEPGQVCGLIGPSGCGKTTLVRLLVGLANPTAGTVRVEGVQPAKFTTRDREQIGYTPQGFILYPTLTVMENAKFVAQLYGVGWRQRRRRIREVLTFLEIWDARKRMASDISGGMQRRLSLACALIHQPRILFVDEPTAGLDPVLRNKIWSYLQQYRDRGNSVIVTTQYIDEAIYCDSVAVLNRGGVVAYGTPESLRQQALGGEALDVEGNQFERGDIVALYELPSVRSVQWTDRGELRLSVDDIGAATVAITETLHNRGTEVTAVRPYLPTFDEVYMKLVGSK